MCSPWAVTPMIGIPAVSWLALIRWTADSPSSRGIHKSITIAKTSAEAVDKRLRMGERFEAVSRFDDSEVAEVQPEAPHAPQVVLIVGDQQLLRPAAGAPIDLGGNGAQGRVIGELVRVRLSGSGGQGAHAVRWYLKIGHVALNSE